MEFEIDDIIEASSLDGLKVVRGIIHDDEVLFVSDYFSNEKEIAVNFKDVEKRWSLNEHIEEVPEIFPGIKEALENF